MPPIDTQTLVAVAVLGVAIWYAFSGKRPAIARSPGRALIDTMEETGREAAGRHIQERLGRQKAAEFAKSFSAAFADEAPKA